MKILNLVWGILLLLALGWLLLLFVVLKPAATSEFLARKGNAAFEKAGFGDAEVFYHLAAQNDQKTTATVLYNLGNSYYRQGRLTEATQVYQNYLKSYKTGPAWYNLGNAFFLSGDTVKSLQAFKQALLLDKYDRQTRQNFLFVLQTINQAARKKEQAGKNNQEDKKEQPARETGKQDDQNKGKPGKEQPDQKTEISEKEMDDMLNQISKNEEALRGKINNAKQANRKLPPGELDY